MFILKNERITIVNAELYLSFVFFSNKREKKFRITARKIPEKTTRKKSR